MTQARLSKLLKIIITGVALIGLAVYLWVIPEAGKAIAVRNPEFSYCYYPWLILLWITGVPCYIALFYCQKIASSLGRDKAFTFENGKMFKRISLLAAYDSVFFVVMNVIYLFLNMNHPGIVLCSVLVLFAGAAISVICAGLSQLVNKAAALQEQSDLTI